MLPPHRAFLLKALINLPRDRAGYSLVELLLVAGLLVLLATAAFPNIYNTFSKSATAVASEVVFQVTSAKTRSVVDAGGNNSWDNANPNEGTRFASIAPYLAASNRPTVLPLPETSEQPPL